MPRPRSVSLAVRSLEDRTTPATVAYRPATQALLVQAADGDQLELRIAAPEAPVAFLQLVEVGSGNMLFNSTDAARPVRSLFVNSSRVATGSLLIGAAVRLGGNLDLVGARTTQSLTLLGQVAGNVTYTDLAAAADTVELATNARVGGSLSLKLGDGTNVTRLKTATVGGNLSVGGRHGADTVELMALGPVTVGGSATFALGNGANTLTGMAANRLTTGRDFVYGGLAGADTINFATAGADLTAGGLAKVTLGGPIAAGENLAYFDNLVVGGSVSFVGGRGGDDVEFFGGLTAGGDFTFTAGDGYNYLDFNFESDATNTIGGKVSYTGGVNLDVVYVDGTTIGKSAVFDLKDAVGLPSDPTDPLYNKQGVRLGQFMPAGNRIYGSLGIKSGTADFIDFIDIARTDVFNGLTVDVGGGVDIVRVNDSFIFGPARFNLGDGNDALRLEMDDVDGFGVPLDRMTSFGGPVSVLGGAGEDTFLISSDGVASTFVRFGGLVTADGGAGADTLTVAPETTFAVGPPLTTF